MKALSQECMKQLETNTTSKRLRRSDTLKILRAHLADDIIATAEKWRANWELASNGYCDAMKNNGGPTLAGNFFTFTLLRGKAWKPIKDFRDYAGPEKHAFLVQLLALGWSFTTIGRYNWPRLSKSRQKHKAVEHAVLILAMLHEYTQQQHRSEREYAIKAARAYQAYPSLSTLCREYHLAEDGMRRLIVRGQKILRNSQIA